ASDEALLGHARAIAAVIPLFGFYLQPSVGGRALSFRFWCRFAEITNVVAIKIAPFDRYRTIDGVRAVAETGRAGEIALYTGNDDSIDGRGRGGRVDARDRGTPRSPTFGAASRRRVSRQRGPRRARRSSRARGGASRRAHRRGPGRDRPARAAAR